MGGYYGSQNLGRFYRLVKEIQTAGGVDFTMPLLLGYTGPNDTLLQKYKAESAKMWQGSCEELPYTMVGSVVGTHGGPGAVVVAFLSPESNWMPHLTAD